MSLRPVLNVVGVLLVFLAGAMACTSIVSLLYRDGDTIAFLLSAAITFVVGVVTYRSTRFEGDITHRQGYATVTFAWTFIALFGALPFILTGAAPTPVQGFFEAMSGFTTTGATVFTDIESLPHGILFWRSFTHWLGGMGIIVLAIAVLPFLGVGGMQLFRAEVPGPTPERLQPRITQTAKLLWYVYVGITALQVVLYLVGGMSLFDSLNHAMATLATGGFSTKNDSAIGFSAYHQYVTILFMYLAGVNFTLHFRAASGRPVYFKDEEWRFFTVIVVLSGLFLAGANLLGGEYAASGAGVEHAVRDGLFQATSIVTTTGFVSADYELWVPAAQGLLLTLMFTGGMAGSTGGGVKSMRVLLTLKYVAIQIRKHLHPRAILLAWLGRRAVRDDVLGNVVGFVFLYVMLCLFGTMLMSLLGMDLLTAFGASAATVGNIGPGVGAVGATDNYGWIGDPALIALSFLMLVGRLEIYTVLLLFHPEMWTRRQGGGRRPTVVRALESKIQRVAGGGEPDAPAPEWESPEPEVVITEPGAFPVDWPEPVTEPLPAEPDAQERAEGEVPEETPNVPERAEGEGPEEDPDVPERAEGEGPEEDPDVQERTGGSVLEVNPDSAGRPASEAPEREPDS